MSPGRHPAAILDRNHVLLVREHLASGREIVLVYDRKGQPLHGWDVDSLPSAWLAESAWHPAGIAVGGIIDNQTLPNLIPTPENDTALWLAMSYRYLSPLLGTWSLPLSSLGLFESEISEELAILSYHSRVLEIGDRFNSTSSTSGDLKPYSLSPEKCVPVNGTIHITGVVENLPATDGFFDCIICRFVLEHLLNPSRALKEMARALAYGGQLILAIPVDNKTSGKPPWFHRWRFVFDGEQLPPRTMALNALDMRSLGLTCRCGAGWTPKMQTGDGYLFVFDKDARDDNASQNVSC